MGYRLKSNKRSSGKDASQLKPDPKEKLTWKQFLRDERTRKISGVLALLIAGFLFVSFSSYLFTWQEDQDKVLNHGISILLPSGDLKAENLLGNVGAYIAHQFFYNGLGLASYFFCSFFFVIGVNGLYNRNYFQVWRNFRYVLLGSVYFSMLFSFVLSSQNFPWGGALGDLLNEWLVRIAGNLGTGSLLFAGGLSFVIWKFNPVFRVPRLSQVLPKLANTPEVPAEEVFPVPELEVLDPEPVPSRPNTLKSERGIVVIPPKDEQLSSPDPTPHHEPPVVPVEAVLRKNAAKEVEEEPLPMTATELAESTLSVNSILKKPVDIELEIKNTQAAAEEAVADANVKDLEPYEPTLDLRDYKYPTLELLHNHGSDR
ncbi:MAG: DNA translocase FtsK 4TM domain-containing protein, partial [Chitinophagaceae bacterium]